MILVARRFADERSFIDILHQAKPGWLIGAVLLQALTYAAQAQVYRIPAHAGGAAVSFATAYKISLAKLFIDQALPSGGLSGTIVIARVLEQRGMPAALVMACLVVDAASYYASYAASLTAAIAFAALGGHLGGHFGGALLAVALLFILFTAAVSLILVAFAGRRAPAFVQHLTRPGLVRRAVVMFESVDPRLARSPGILLRAAVYQVSIVLLDAATVWMLILALGILAPPAAVFASFVTSSLLRTFGILPGGLGSFEAASVLTLKIVGVPVAVGLSATLAFRVLSFWLPMLPGLWFSRSVAGPRATQRETSGR